MSANGLYDLCIVGAGPAGSTCAYYLARLGLRVLLLEKEKFPRDKLCGDAVCGRAQMHLRRMGVLDEILRNNQGRRAEVGGMVSPSGIGFIGNSTPHVAAPLAIAIKRIVLDEKIARAAEKAGARLVEQSLVAGAEFSQQDRLWTVHTRADGRPQTSYQARVLVAADGATSQLARSLGIVTTKPDAVCSRTYVRASTTNFDADGVLFYPPELLPGYFAVFREADDELNLCCYIIPGGSCSPKQLRQMYDKVIRGDPHVSRALGPAAQLGNMQGAALRLGGVPRSFADHLLLLGDAAGHIDPLTGEGIQYAMDAAEIAADTLGEAFSAGDWSAAVLKRYQERWQKSFGRDFYWSAKIARWSTRYPILLDAGAALTRRRGTRFLAEWGAVMTGVKPKSHFLRPQITLPLVRELILQWWRNRRVTCP